MRDDLAGGKRARLKQHGGGVGSSNTTSSGELNNRGAGRPGVPHHKSTCECGLCLKMLKQHEAAQARAEQLARIGSTPKKVQTSLKHRKFVKELCREDGKAFADPKAAAVSAGYSPRAAEDLLKDRAVRQLLLAEMTRQGLNEQALVASLRAGLEAFETKLATRDGMFTDEQKTQTSARDISSSSSRTAYVRMF